MNNIKAERQESLEAGMPGDEKTNMKKEGSLKEKHVENTESMESKQRKLIDLHI